MKKINLTMGGEKNQKTTLYGKISGIGKDRFVEISEKNPGDFYYEISISHGNEKKRAMIELAISTIESPENWTPENFPRGD